MSDLNLLPEQETSEELLEKLADSLPTLFPKDESKNNYSIYGPIATKENNFVKDIHKVREAKEIKNAETFDQLVEIAKFVDVYPRSGEGLEEYRFRVLSNFKNITNEGSISDILEFASYIFETPVGTLFYKESSVPGLIFVGIPTERVETSKLPASEVTKLLKNNVSAGKDLQGLSTGSFSYASPEEYGSQSHISENGYGTIDSNGDVVEDGGTYSSLLG